MSTRRWDPLRDLLSLQEKMNRLFEDSLEQSHARFGALLRDVGAGRLEFPNTNFDTGQPTRAGEYILADETHAEWLESLAKADFDGASPAVRRSLTSYYEGATSPDLRDKKARKTWTRLQAALDRLEGVPLQTAQRLD